ncbi:zinc finger MYM-type protein 1-like protein, partial [Tanacetum coccineum]
DNVEKQGGNDAFVINWFNSWHKKAYLYAHVGNVDSYHNKAFQKCENQLKENQSIVDAFNKKSEIEKARYIIRLNTTISCVRLCLKTENLMRGHDEYETSLFKGMFLEVYHFLRDHNKAIRAVTLENAPKNCTLTSSQIQKDVVDYFAKEIVKSICLEVGTDVFSLLVDESSDVSKKEQMAIVLRYVDKYGLVEICCLKDRVMIEQVICVLVVVAVAKNHYGVDNFFDILSTVTNVVCGSCKPKDMMRESYKERLEKEIARGEIETGKGKNQEVLNYVKDDEFGDRFRESSTELLENMTALSPHNSFTDFNVSKLVKLSEMYPHDFTYMERLRLPTDLAVYYQIMSNDKDFSELSSISKLASLMVEKNKHISHPLVYRLLKLALILPVATAIVERCFSKMKLVKTDLHNRMGEEYFNGALIYAIEKEELININVTNEVVRKQFFSMKDRKGSK